MAATTKRKTTATRRVTITMRELFDLQIEQGEVITKGFAEVKEQIAEVTNVLALQNQKAEQTEIKVNDHETRIRTVEKQNWKTLGFGSAIGSIVSVFGVLIANALHLVK